MPRTALLPQTTEIPPDVAAVLSDAPIHPELLLQAPSRPAPPTAATLTKAALAFATFAANAVQVRRDQVHLDRLHPDTAERHALGAKGIIHSVDKGGVLHLRPTDALRAVSVVRGALAQHGSQRPPLQPGAVRLVPAGRALTLTDLAGEGALAVEVLV